MLRAPDLARVRRILLGMKKTRALILVLGDQLDRNALVLRQSDPSCDRVVMAEVDAEIRAFPNHKQRVALFIAAMRHFADDMREAGWRLTYQSAGSDNACRSLPEFLARMIEDYAPQEIRITTPGRYDLGEAFERVCGDASVPLNWFEDTHFLATRQYFAKWAKGRKALTLEYFYREMRKKNGILLEGKKPVGGSWNYDKENRDSFGKEGPQNVPEPVELSHEETEHVRAVIDLIHSRYDDLPGELERLYWPVTPDQARQCMEEFFATRIEDFGPVQDAMWTDEPWLFHSRLSTALNMRLLDPRDVVARAVDAYESGDAPLNSVEGFIRQILGWREFIRGVYWLKMPRYLELNELEADQELPPLFWDGETQMHCLSQVVGQLLKYGYAHHIQRLMVAGLFTLMYGVNPREVHEWFMAYYVDSVEWVTLPNVVGMSQYADGGVVGTKPYIATGKYVQRQSNYCSECRFDPAKASGEDACPFTTLYWEFLDRHHERFADHHRMALQVRNLERKTEEDLEAIRDRACQVRKLAAQGEL